MKEMETHISNNPSSRPGTFDLGGSIASKHEDNIRLLCKLRIRVYVDVMRIKFALTSLILCPYALYLLHRKL